MKFITQSGSIYEVDQESKKVRRLSGYNDPTDRQGKDREWKTYVDCSLIEVGKCALFVWDIDGEVAKSTLTSVVKEIY